MSAHQDTFLMAGNSKMRMSLFHQKRLPDWTSSGWLPAIINMRDLLPEGQSMQTKSSNFLTRCLGVLKEDLCRPGQCNGSSQCQDQEPEKNLGVKRTVSLYLPPYSPQLNLAETLWRILKGKWIRPMDYKTTDSLFYSTNRALAAVGHSLFVNYSKCA